MPTKYDAIIIGSGFGGCMTAYKLIGSGLKVLMLERGDWVQRGPENWEANQTLELTPQYDNTSALRVEAGGNKPLMGQYSCVGGPSVYYGGVSFRFRAADFNPPEDIIGDSGAQWPISYDDLEPFYDEAEKLLNISGESGVDPTEPHRNQAYPQKVGALAEVSVKVKQSAEKLGLKPFQLPLAINYHDHNRSTCQNCTTCDTFACAVSAKNDLATMIIPDLIEKGMELRPNCLVLSLERSGSRITEVKCIDKSTNQTITFQADKVILSGGALASPALLLSSGLDQNNRGGDLIGRYLMRHLNAIIFGIYPGAADKEKRFHKQIAILDYYFGHPSLKTNFTKIGSLQQIPTPNPGIVENEVKGILGKTLGKAVKLLTGLLAIAEDQPQYSNRLWVDSSKKDKYDLPQPVIFHQYSKRDKEALKLLINPAKKIINGTGALAHYVHHIRTFSHAVGTVRMGENPQTSVLDRNCQFRGLDNLWVVDGSFMPASAAVNPSLTIAANALRVGGEISEKK
ncbi:MAG: GMC family oxidoreductase [Bacteroidetes bacterium]|nr:GMC family oxidoreductase [Bacteroidota bacterium]MDA1119079.1 GMC family oxidoreductase [Bacteroidota bacterium]